MRLRLHHLFLALVTTLTGTSLFFTIQVIRFKRSLNVAGASAGITSGQTVTIERVIDGDEVVVRADGALVTIRMLGIASFDPTLNDPAIQPAARQAVLYLERTLRGKPAQVVFQQFKLDAKKRLLAYLHRDGEDAGEAMVRHGLTLCYTRYPFSRLAAYAKAEEEARARKAGIWGDLATAERARQLRSVWDAERSQEE